MPKLISRIRDHYLDQFLSFVDAQRDQWSSGYAEVKFEIHGENSLFRKLYCTDFSAKDGDAALVREMYPDRILTFEPVNFGVQGVPVLMERLVWDDVELHHHAVSIAPDKLDDWFNYWFDPDDVRVNPTSTAGIVHSLSVQPAVVETDLGSAPPEALWDILHLIASSGATKIRVTSSRAPAIL